MNLKINKNVIILLVLFLAIVIFRTYIALNMDNFSNDESYYNLRITNNLLTEHKFLVYDELSYGGKPLLQPQLFHLILALLSFGNITLLKILPEIFITSSIFVVYLISKEISENEYASIIAALFSGLVPLLFFDMLNVLSSYTLAIPLLLFMTYCLLKLDNKNYLWIFIALSFIIPLIHPIALVFVAVSIFYLLLLSGGSLNPTKIKKEAIIAASLIILLIEFIFYKKAFFLYGARILWQNTPANVIADAFKQLSVVDLLIGVGFVPLLLGAIGVYFGITKEKKKPVYLFSALIFSILTLLVFRLLTISIGIALLGLALSCLASLTIRYIIDYGALVKFTKAKTIILTFIMILFLVTSFLPIYSAVKNLQDINNEKIEDMKWIKETFPENITVLTNLREGNLVTGIAQRRSVIDYNFIMAPNPIERLKDAEKIYTTFTGSVALELIKKYNINLVYLSDETRTIYNMQKLVYAEDNPCFKKLGDEFYVIKC